MKLRLHAGSLRLRLSQSEVACFKATGKVEDSIEFAPGSRLSYTMESGRHPKSPRSSTKGHSRRRPKSVAAQWTESDERAWEPHPGLSRSSSKKIFSASTASRSPARIPSRILSLPVRIGSNENARAAAPRRSPVRPKAVHRCRSLHRRHAHALEQKRVTSRQLVTQYLIRIAIYDHQLRAAISVNPKLLRKPTAWIANEPLQGARPLHGIPIALKDNIQTTDMPTTGGALAFAGYVPHMRRRSLKICAPPERSSSPKPR